MIGFEFGSRCNVSSQPEGRFSSRSMRLDTSSPRFFAVLVDRIWLRWAGLISQRAAHAALARFPMSPIKFRFLIS
ncbi:hypothetical protein D3C85_1748100 [compost metagenome]